jgi:hypothetical protein
MFKFWCCMSWEIANRKLPLLRFLLLFILLTINSQDPIKWTLADSLRMNWGISWVLIMMDWNLRISIVYMLLKVYMNIVLFKSVFWWNFSGQVPCPAGSYLMSQSVDEKMKTWSTCTQKMIDAEDQRREKLIKEGRNCLFT